MTVESDSIPKVSVCVVTYNQEAFIEECLSSIVTQQTNFPFEVIVSDDASTDRTEAIVQAFVKSHPTQVRLIRLERNIGASANYLAAHKAANGDYVAHMDGDDVMLPGRLQKQADFLDRFPDCVFVGSNAIEFGTERNGDHRFEGYSLGQPHLELLDFDRFVELNGFLFAHSSKMYRRALAPDLGSHDRLFDVQMHVLQAAAGKVGYIHEPLVKYRMRTGISVGRDGFQDHVAAAELAEWLGASASAVRTAYARACYHASLDALRSGAHGEFRRRISLSKRYGRLSRARDAVWRNALYGIRNDPQLLRLAVGAKDGFWRFRRRLAGLARGEKTLRS
jgi:glycosyltransferase involved in cell wall biosynthesis